MLTRQETGREDALAADGDAGPAAIIAGTTIGRNGRGVIIRGPTGSGKSALALRALTTPMKLPGEPNDVTFDFVSDDQTEIRRSGGRLIARAPEAIRGLIEVRGIGIVTWPALADVAICLVVDISATPTERLPMPDDQTCRLLDVAVPRIDILGSEASALAKLAVATGHWSGGMR